MSDVNPWDAYTRSYRQRKARPPTTLWGALGIPFDPDAGPDTDHDGEGVTLTPALIHAGRSGSGGWNKRQLAAIGIDWDELQRSGWIDRAAGRVVSRAAYARFLALKGEAGRKPRGRALR